MHPCINYATAPVYSIPESADFFALRRTARLERRPELLRRDDRERLLFLERLRDVLLLELLEALDLEDLGVLDRLADLLGVRLLRADLRREERRDLLGALGVRARRLEDLRLDLLLLEGFGVLLRRFGVRLRRLGVRLRRLGVRLRFCFLAGLRLDTERARFLIPISLLRFSFMSCLYLSRPAAHV